MRMGASEDIFDKGQTAPTGRGKSVSGWQTMSKTGFIGKASSAAGGWGALKSVGKRLLESGAPISGVRTLLKTNQPDGFDCPGCAWGDPEHGSSFEFCENGVKAVSWEATEARVLPEQLAEGLGHLRALGERGWRHRPEVTGGDRYTVGVEQRDPCIRASNS